MIRNLLLLLILLLIAAASTIGQTDHKTKVDSLKAKAKRLDQKFKEEKTKADKWANDKNLPNKKESPDASMNELVGYREDRPLYYTTVNINAATTVASNRLWPGGSNGLNLTGVSQIIGEWDGGGVLTTHQELLTRVQQMDNPSSISNHSTHVAGTLMASGLDVNARGMAYEATLHAYDWLNDLSEMSLAAAAGLLLSNHSYTYIRGWHYNLFGDDRWVWMGDLNYSLTEDCYFGLYSLASRIMDDIACDAPYYLIVKPVGNDRDDNGPAPGAHYWLFNGGNLIDSADPRDADGPWDCIPDDAIGKNILTVGAIDDIIDGDYSAANIDLKTASFSSFGPADDGRIKPDIVTNGVGVYSTFASSPLSYYILNGTSMAAPNATGSLTLLQQHYQNTHQNHNLLAATLKALLIHTAHESGPHDGPDYKTGWGLLNTEAAAQVISQDQTIPLRLQELTLLQGIPYTITISTDGTQPLKVTICWTDPPGTPVYGLNPSTPILVNDLDLRLSRVSDGQVTLPYRLDRNNPAAAATQGDNSVDNVEQVFLATPAAGAYTISVNHKGILLNGQQDFSMIITGASAHIQSAPAINTRLELVSDDFDTPVAGEGTLTLNVMALSTDGLAHAIQDFQGGLQLDPIFCEQVMDIVFSNPFFPISSYGTRSETYVGDAGNPDQGRISYQYHFTGGTRETIDTIPVCITTVIIHYLMGSDHGHISWNNGTSFFAVTDENSTDVTGDEETMPLDLLDIALPVELNRFEATDTGRCVLLKWTTQSEDENLGFHLYRSEGATDNFVQITGSLIPGAGTTQNVHHYIYEDYGVDKGKRYYYKLMDVNYRGRVTYHGPIAVAVAPPEVFALQQNYPNPFNPSTRIAFSLPRNARTSLIVYNLQGQVIRTLFNQPMTSGRHEWVWDGRDDEGRQVPSGMYFYTLMSEELHKTRRMQLVK
ncbi:S8 family serine peptidase [candidate division KSB1 bacterium]|nr:S8 family serine peptidase [candidate division KSB1 bacterium]